MGGPSHNGSKGWFLPLLLWLRGRDSNSQDGEVVGMVNRAASYPVTSRRVNVTVAAAAATTR